MTTVASPLADLLSDVSHQLCDDYPELTPRIIDLVLRVHASSFAGCPADRAAAAARRIEAAARRDLASLAGLSRVDRNAPTRAE